MKKNNYYFTFGTNHSLGQHPNYPKAHHNGWVRIIASDYGKAREKAVEIFGTENGFIKFSFQYKEAVFDKSYFPAGEIEVFEV